MQLLLLYDYDPDEEAIVLPDVLDSGKDDFIVIWRQWGEQFAQGYMVHVLPVGVYAGINDKQIHEVLDTIDPHLTDASA